MEKIKVLFLDQREIIRNSLFSIFTDDPKIEMVDRFDRIANWPELIEKCRPDIVIIDVGYTGTAIVRTIKQRHNKQIILAISDIPKEVEFLDVFQAGVKAYLKTEDLTIESLRAAIEFSMKDIVLLSRPFSDVLYKYLAPGYAHIDDSLTISSEQLDQSSRLSDQEKVIIALTMLGASNRDIAKFLHITENTAKVHLRNIMGKLGVKGKQKLAFFVRTHHHLRNELLIDYNYVKEKIIK